MKRKEDSSLHLETYVKYEFMRSETKFAFTKKHLPGGRVLQMAQAFLRKGAGWKHIVFSKQFPILTLDTGEITCMNPPDPVFRKFRDFCYDIMEDRLTDYIMALENLIAHETDQFADVEEMREEFVPWQAQKIITSGDVENGAEQIFFTAEGQELLRNPKYAKSNRLMRKIAAAQLHKDAAIQQDLGQYAGNDEKLKEIESGRQEGS